MNPAAGSSPTTASVGGSGPATTVRCPRQEDDAAPPAVNGAGRDGQVRATLRIPKAVAEAIVSARVASGLTVADLAARADVPPGRLVVLESGRASQSDPVAALGDLQRIASRLGFPPGALVNETLSAWSGAYTAGRAASDAGQGRDAGRDGEGTGEAAGDQIGEATGEAIGRATGEATGEAGLPLPSTEGGGPGGASPERTTLTYPLPDSPTADRAGTGDDHRRGRGAALPDGGAGAARHPARLRRVLVASVWAVALANVALTTLLVLSLLGALGSGGPAPAGPAAVAAGRASTAAPAAGHPRPRAASRAAVQLTWAAGADATYQVGGPRYRLTVTAGQPSWIQVESPGSTPSFAQVVQGTSPPFSEAAPVELLIGAGGTSVEVAVGRSVVSLTPVHAPFTYLFEPN